MQTSAVDTTTSPSHYETAEKSRRIHQRVKTNLPARFMRTTKEEHPCTVVDVSVGGINVESAIPVDLGEKILCYIQDIGRVEGIAIRNHETGFAIQFMMTQHSLDKLADHLTWLVNRQYLDAQDQRSSIRKIPEKSLSVMTLGDGTQQVISLLDVSLGGAMIKSDFRPPVNANIHLGSLRAKVLRHHEQGFSVSFLDIQKSGLSS